MSIECSTCLEPFTSNCSISTTPCGHVFHFQCIKKWYWTQIEGRNFQKNCPKCRKSFPFHHMVKTFFSQSDENPLNDALEEAESKCNQLRKSKEILEKEIHELKIDNAKIVKNEEKLKIEVANHLLIIEKKCMNLSKNLNCLKKFENIEKDRNELKAAKEKNERVHKNTTTKLRNTIEKLEKEVGEMKNSKDEMAENRKLDKQNLQRLEQDLKSAHDLILARNEIIKKSVEKIGVLELAAKRSEITINVLSSQKDTITEAALKLEKQVDELNAKKDETAKNSEKVINELKIKMENVEKIHQGLHQKLTVDNRKLELIISDLKVQKEDIEKNSEKEINELKDVIKKKEENETFLDWILENNQMGKNGETMLHTAAKNGHEAICHMILDTLEDHNKNPKSETGMTPLHYAANYGYKDICKRILDEQVGEDKNPKSNTGSTPLHYAAFNGHVEIYKMIIEVAKDKNPKDVNGNTPLKLAAQFGQIRKSEMDEIEKIYTQYKPKSNVIAIRNDSCCIM